MQNQNNVDVRTLSDEEKERLARGKPTAIPTAPYRNREDLNAQHDKFARAEVKRALGFDHVDPTPQRMGIAVGRGASQQDPQAGYDSMDGEAIEFDAPAPPPVGEGPEQEAEWYKSFGGQGIGHAISGAADLPATATDILALVAEAAGEFSDADPSVKKAILQSTGTPLALASDIYRAVRQWASDEPDSGTSPSIATAVRAASIKAKDKDTSALHDMAAYLRRSSKAWRGLEAVKAAKDFGEYTSGQWAQSYEPKYVTESKQNLQSELDSADGVLSTIGAIVTNPVAVADIVMSSATEMVLAGGISGVASKISTKTAGKLAKEMVEAGVAKDAKSALKYLNDQRAKIVGKTVLAEEALSVSAGVRKEVYDAINTAEQDNLESLEAYTRIRDALIAEGRSEAYANDTARTQLAELLSSRGVAMAAMSTLAAGKLTGIDKITGKLFTGTRLAGTRKAAAGTAALAESGQEFLQEGTEAAITDKYAGAPERGSIEADWGTVVKALKQGTLGAFVGGIQGGSLAAVLTPNTQKQIAKGADKQRIENSRPPTPSSPSAPPKVAATLDSVSETIGRILEIDKKLAELSPKVADDTASIEETALHDAMLDKQISLEESLAGVGEVDGENNVKTDPIGFLEDSRAAVNAASKTKKVEKAEETKAPVTEVAKEEGPVKQESVKKAEPKPTQQKKKPAVKDTAAPVNNSTPQREFNLDGTGSNKTNKQKKEAIPATPTPTDEGGGDVNRQTALPLDNPNSFVERTKRKYDAVFLGQNKLDKDDLAELDSTLDFKHMYDKNAEGNKVQQRAKAFKVHTDKVKAALWTPLKGETAKLQNLISNVEKSTGRKGPLNKKLSRKLAEVNRLIDSGIEGKTPARRKMAAKAALKKLHELSESGVGHPAIADVLAHADKDSGKTKDEFTKYLRDAASIVDRANKDAKTKSFPAEFIGDILQTAVLAAPESVRTPDIDGLVAKAATHVSNALTGVQSASRNRNTAPKIIEQLADSIDALSESPVPPKPKKKKPAAKGESIKAKAKKKSTQETDETKPDAADEFLAKAEKEKTSVVSDVLSGGTNTDSGYSVITPQEATMIKNNLEVGVDIANQNSRVQGLRADKSSNASEFIAEFVGALPPKSKARETLEAMQVFLSSSDVRISEYVADRVVGSHLGKYLAHAGPLRKSLSTLREKYGYSDALDSDIIKIYNELKEDAAISGVGDGTVILNDDVSSDPMLVYSFIHELGHAVTVPALTNDPTLKAAMDEIYRDFTTEVNKSGAVSPEVSYATKNPLELATEFLVNQEVQNAMKAMPANETVSSLLKDHRAAHKSLYDQMVDAVLSILKRILPSSIKPKTFFDQMLEVSAASAAVSSDIATHGRPTIDTITQLRTLGTELGSDNKLVTPPRDALLKSLGMTEAQATKAADRMRELVRNSDKVSTATEQREAVEEKEYIEDAELELIALQNGDGGGGLGELYFNDIQDNPADGGAGAAGRSKLQDIANTTGKIYRRVLETSDGLVEKFSDSMVGVNGKELLRGMLDNARRRVRLGTKYIHDNFNKVRYVRDLLASKGITDVQRQSLTSLMLDASYQQIDPRIPLQVHTWLSDKQKKAKRPLYSRVRSEYNSLPPPLKEVFKTLTSYYKDANNKMHTALVKALMYRHGMTNPSTSLIGRLKDVKSDEDLDEILSTMPPHIHDRFYGKGGQPNAVFEGTAKMLLSTNKQYNKQKNGIYVPSYRDGTHGFSLHTAREHVVSTKEAAEKLKGKLLGTRGVQGGVPTVKIELEGDSYLVTESEKGFRVNPSSNENLREIAELNREGFPDGWKVTNKLIPRNIQKDSVGMLSTEEVLNVIKKLSGENTEGSPAIQEFYKMLPDSSMLTRHVKRQGIAGTNVDLVQGMAKYVESTGRYISALETAPEQAKLRADIEKVNEGKTPEEKDRNDSIVAELAGRIDRNDSSGALLQVLSGHGFTNTLMSPSHPIINLHQPWMLTVPYLSGKYHGGTSQSGINSAFSYVSRAHGRVMGPAIRKVLAERGGANALSGDEVVYDDMFRQIKANVGEGPLADDINSMLDKLVETGSIEHTFTNELHEMASSPVSSLNKKDTAVGAKILEGAGEGAHRVLSMGRVVNQISEMVNRSVTAIAAYEMARDSGQSHEVAVKEAQNAIDQTQINYDILNRPDWMVGNAALKVISAMKMYPLGLYSMISTQIYRGFMREGRSQEDKAKAMRTLAGVALVSQLFTGTSGALFIEPVRLAATILNSTLGLVGLGLDEAEDEILDRPERLVYDMVEQVAGPQVAEFITYGMYNAMLGIDFSSRAGMHRLLTNTSQEHGFEWWADTFGSSLIGPIVGSGYQNVKSYIRAIESGQGKVEATLKYAIPVKFIRDLTQAYERATEGLLSKSGRQLLPPSAKTAASKAFGFTPHEEAVYWADRMSDWAQQDVGKSARRSALASYVQASLRGRSLKDAKEEISEYNRTIAKARLGKRITIKDVTRAVKEARERERQSKYNPSGLRGGEEGIEGL